MDNQDQAQRNSKNLQVNPSSDIPGPIGPRPLKGKAAPEIPRDDVDFAGSTGLARALEDIPAVRADKVAKAKALVTDPSYPNEAALSRVAGVLADHINSPDQPE